VSRANTKTWFNLVASLIVGTAGPALCVQAGPPEAPGQPGPGRPATPALTSADVQAKLKQARQELVRYNFDAAEQLAREAARMGVSPGSGEDTPQAVLQEAARCRTDPKITLAAARAALERGDFTKAELYAHQSEHLATTWTFSVWGDNPAKVLKEIQAARTQNTGRPPAAAATANAGPAGAQSAGKPETPGVIQAKAVADAKPIVDPAVEKVRNLVKQARTALAAGDFAKAHKLAEQAQAAHVTLHWVEDTPEKVLSDIARAEAPAKPGSAPAVTQAKPSSPANTTLAPPAGSSTAAASQDPRELLKKGRALLAEGKLDEATKVALQVRAMNVFWGLFEDNPDKLRTDIVRAEAQRPLSKPAPAAVAQAKPPAPALPAANVTPSAKPSAEENPRELLKKGRALLAEGKLAEANQVALKVWSLNANWGLLEDNPEKLRTDIARAQALRQPSTPAPVAVAQAKPPVPPATPAPATTAVAAGKTTPSPKEDPRELLKKGRAFLAEGKLAEASQVALKVRGMDATWGLLEDNPDKLRADIVRAGGQRQPNTIITVAARNPPSAKEDPRELLKKGRALLAAGKLAEANQVALQVKGMTDVHWGLYEDTPDKLKVDIARAEGQLRPGTPSVAAAVVATPGGSTPPSTKEDPHELLKKGRALLAEGKFDEASQTMLKLRGMDVRWGMFEDNPDKLRADIVRAETQRRPSTDVAAAAPQAKPGMPPVAAAVVATPAGSPPPSTKEDPHELLKKGRALLAEGKLDEASQTMLKLRGMDVRWSLFEDNPDKLRADIVRAETQRRPSTDIAAAAPQAKPSTPTAPAPVVVAAAAKTTPSAKEDPRELLKKGRALLADGKLDEATQAMLKAKSLADSRWSLFEDTPDKLKGDIDRARTSHDKEEAIKTLADARKLMDKGDYDAATRAAYRAQKQHGPYSVWDIGDRPAKVLAEIATAQKKNKNLPASSQTELAKNTGASDKAPGALASNPNGNSNTGTTPAALASAGGQPPAGGAGAGPQQQQARQLLADARMALKNGDTERARFLADHVRQMNVALNQPNDDSPTAIYQEIQKVAKAQTTPSGTGLAGTHLAGQPGGSLGLPLGANTNVQMGGLGSVAPVSPVTPDPPVAPVPPGDAVAQATRPEQPIGPMAPTMLPGPNPADSVKQGARQLLVQARELQRAGKLLEARQKVQEAERAGVLFSLDEDNPGSLSMELAAQARQRIDVLIHNAVEATTYNKGEPMAQHQKAENDLLEAQQLAQGFGQDCQPIERKLAWVRQTRLQASVQPAQDKAVTEALAKLEAARQELRGGETGKARQLASEAAKVPGVSEQANAFIGTLDAEENNQRELAARRATAAGQAKALAMLESARLELRSGETTNARRLAMQAAEEAGVREQAMTVIRTIDAEENNQRSLEARRAFDAALQAYRRRDYAHAGNVLAAIDHRLLDPDRKNRMREIMMTPEMAAGGRQPVTAVAANNPPPGAAKPAGPGVGLPVPPPSAGHATATDNPANSLLSTTLALREVKFQEMRSNGLEAQRMATEKFRAGQPDEALDILSTYLESVAECQLDDNQKNLLRRPVDQLRQQFALLKTQNEFLAGDARQRDQSKQTTGQLAKVEENRQKRVSELMKQANAMFKEGKYLESERYAMQAKELDPDNGVATAMAYMARTQRNLNKNTENKKGREEMFMTGLGQAEDEGPSEAVTNGFAYDPKRWETAKKRGGDMSAIGLPRRNEKEREIEHRLSLPVSLNWTDAPLRQVIDDLRAWQGINIWVDDQALASEAVSLDRPVTFKAEQISLKSALTMLLRGAGLTHVIKDEVLQITTEAQAKGKLETKTFLVADLVIPIENFGDVHNGMPAVMPGQRVRNNHGYDYPSPVTGRASLALGDPVGTPTGSSGSQGNGAGFASENRGSSTQISKRGPNQTQEEMLISLVTSCVAPRSWTNMGGPGTIDYFPPTMSLVINQTPDIQEQILDLLNALRRLQDQEVSVEVRFISLDEAFYERIGVNFNVNIETGNGTGSQAPALTTGVFQAAPFVNLFNPPRLLTGLTPAGTLTSDLNIPINNNTYNLAIPTFGNYPGLPGAGGLTLGLAFLSDIQVFLFLEAVQGDSRTNVMQAPKLTLFNGQTATLNVADQQFFITDAEVIPLQNGNLTFQPVVQQFAFGVNLTIQAVISADRRYVRLSLGPTLTNLTPAPVQLFPIVVPLFPFPQGQNDPNSPVTFTQFIQQPVFTTVQVQTTVAVPDGGTVLLGGLKRLSEARSEYGPPILSKLPYINRLFKNVAFGRETESLLIMVTPRIIIMAEEELNATGVSERPAVGP